LCNVETAGVNGAIIGNATLLNNTATAVAAVTQGTVNTATVAVDTTAQEILELTAKWTTANAGNIITCDNASIEIVKM
jgi:hypothetical protein